MPASVIVVSDKLRCKRPLSDRTAFHGIGPLRKLCKVRLRIDVLPSSSAIPSGLTCSQSRHDQLSSGAVAAR